ncbi:Acyltransferase family protein [Vibrio mangrovi]|nr:Acyltransferase family protein [Vibrio mangrovi]
MSPTTIEINAVQNEHDESRMEQPTKAVMPPNRPKLLSLTGSRFWAAFLVFLFHASIPSDLAPYADPTIEHIFAAIVSKAGWVGVSFFFILSGFVMVWSARDNDTVGNFYLRRFAKIYPTHCLTWAIALALGVVSIGAYKIWLSNLLLVNSWVNDVKYFFVVNRPSWCLCDEILFYLLFPMLFKAMKAIPKKFDLLGIGVAVVASLLIQIFIYFWVEPNHMMPYYPVSQRQFWFSYIFFPSRLFEFVSGMFVARLLIYGRVPVLPKAAALTLLIAVYIGAMFLPYQFGLNVIYIIPVSLLIVSIANDDLNAKKNILNRKSSIWLGEISYAFYMVHFLVLFVLFKLLDGKKLDFMEGTAILAIALILSVSCASLVYRYFEIPMNRKILDIFRPKFLKTITE